MQTTATPPSFSLSLLIQCKQNWTRLICGGPSQEPVDPVLVRWLAEDVPTDPKRLERFLLWPLLLGLTFWSPGVATAALNPAMGNLLNGLDCIAICAHALASAMPDAAAAAGACSTSEESEVKPAFLCAKVLAHPFSLAPLIFLPYYLSSLTPRSSLARALCVYVCARARA